jgi:hypothetical protein
VRGLDRELTLPLAAAAVLRVPCQLGLAALPILVAVGEPLVALGQLTPPGFAARAGMLRLTAALTPAAVIERVRLDLTAVVDFAIAVAIALGATRDLTLTCATHGIGVRELAATSCAIVRTRSIHTSLDGGCTLPVVIRVTLCDRGAPAERVSVVHPTRT